MKKTFALFLCLAILSLTAGSGLAESSPLLYEVRDGEGHVLYLLGTIHVGRDDMYPLSDALWNAYHAADVLAVEADVVAYAGSLIGSIRAITGLMYGLGDNAKNHLSPETYALGIEKLGVSEILLKRLKPAGWYSLAENYMISSVGLDATLGVDYTLLQQAHKENKRIDELESMDAQMAMLLSLPEDIIDAEIRQILTYPQASGLSTLMLYNAWCLGDEKTLESILSLQTADAAYDEFNDILMVTRNEDFEKQAIQYLESGETALIAIGAFHILGDDGLAARLARAGYEVKEIGR